MTLPESATVRAVVRRAMVTCFGLAMLPIGVPLWSLINGLVAPLGILRGDRAFDALVVSVPTALVLVASVAIVTRWWYDRRTSLWIAGSLFPLYVCYFYLIRDAFWI